VLPLASADRSGCVVYLGTLSKILAPNAHQLRRRAASVIDPSATSDVRDRQGDSLAEYAVAELLENGEVQRHAAARASLPAAARPRSPPRSTSAWEAVSSRVPSGGSALWVSAPDLDAGAWMDRCLERAWT
jgi:GntR family transcriptional regulator/MocR family aminotransferase